MGTLWILILCVSIIYGFWHTREVAEAAKQHAQRQIEKQQLQLLSVSCKKRRLAILRNGKPGLKSEFNFEFSSDGESSYQGVLRMEGTKLVDVTMPVYKI